MVHGGIVQLSRGLVVFFIARWRFKLAFFTTGTQTKNEQANGDNEDDLFHESVSRACFMAARTHVGAVPP